MPAVNKAANPITWNLFLLAGSFRARRQSTDAAQSTRRGFLFETELWCGRTSSSMGAETGGGHSLQRGAGDWPASLVGARNADIG
jgi:hypothetical protein